MQFHQPTAQAAEEQATHFQNIEDLTAPLSSYSDWDQFEYYWLHTEHQERNIT